MFEPPTELLGVCTRRVFCLKGVFLVDDVLWSVLMFNTFPKVLFFLPVFLLVFVVFLMGIAGFGGESVVVAGLGIAMSALVEAVVVVAVVVAVVAVVAVGTANREESGDAL